jgi:hypothetical protein
MEEAGDGITEKVQALSDLELAVLICLVADQHCIIEAEKELLRDVQEELKLVSRMSTKDKAYAKGSRSRQMCLGLHGLCWTAMRIPRLMTSGAASWSGKRGMTTLRAKPRGSAARYGRRL